MKIENIQILILVVLCLTLGLAPFLPEPHIVGKLKWILGGAEGMKLMDWFDTILHGSPWIVLMVAFVIRLKKKHDNT